jgi:maltose alpha-D-glucosyltransferase/alpha-amylase
MDRFAPESSMRIYGRGIRRRLPPMLKGNHRHLELAYSLLFALPGTPVIRYGQEIGMGEDLSLPGRLSVRTPMQWTAGKNGGFSNAPADRLVRPVVSDYPFAPPRLNVELQSADPGSLLSFMRRLIVTRRQHTIIGDGAWEILETKDPRMFAHAFASGEVRLVCVHNLSSETVRGQVSLPVAQEPWVDVWSDTRYDAVPAENGEISLTGYGYRWLRARVVG